MAVETSVARSLAFSGSLAPWQQRNILIASFPQSKIQLVSSSQTSMVLLVWEYFSFSSVVVVFVFISVCTRTFFALLIAMFLAECLKLSIPVVNVQFSACNSRGIKRRCLSLELQDRSAYAIGAKSTVRTSSRKGVWQRRTRAMYVDDDDEVSSSFSLWLHTIVISNRWKSHSISVAID
jgi:hypothetical protein